MKALFLTSAITLILTSAQASKLPREAISFNKPLAISTMQYIGKASIARLPLVEIDGKWIMCEPIKDKNFKLVLDVKSLKFKSAENGSTTFEVFNKKGNLDSTIKCTAEVLKGDKLTDKSVKVDITANEIRKYMEKAQYQSMKEMFLSLSMPMTTKSLYMDYWQRNDMDSKAIRKLLESLDLGKTSTSKSHDNSALSSDSAAKKVESKAGAAAVASANNR